MHTQARNTAMAVNAAADPTISIASKTF
jgi:hypothetical protein